MKDSITIPAERYIELMRAERELGALYGAGVDNWSGYDEAISDLEDDEFEELFDEEGGDEA